MSQLNLEDFDSMTEIPVMEFFYTIQGEGKNAGKAAFFIRTAGCNVGCSWCDVKESWTANRSQLLSISFLVQEIQKSGAKSVVITGGEPTMYNLKPLTDALAKIGVERWIETSGAYNISGDWEWVVVSPKKFKHPTKASLKRADELKVVVSVKHDFKWAELNAAQTSKNCTLYLQAEWDRQKKVQALIIDYVKQHPQWQISLQTHKYLNIP